MNFKSCALLVLFFIIQSCKTPRPEINRDVPLELVQTIYDSMPNWDIRVATINTFSVPIIPPNKTIRLSEIGKILHKEKFDIVGLQELFDSNAMSALIENSKYKSFKLFDLKRTGGSGIGFLSNKVLENFTFWYHLLMGRYNNIEFWSGKGIAKTTIKKNGLPVSVFNIHLISRSSEDINDPVDFNSVDRLSEVFEIFTQVIEQRESDAFIVLGDLNYNIYNKEYEFFNKLTGLKGTLFQEQNLDNCTFCPENTFNSKNEGQLDYIYISPRMRFISKNVFLNEKVLIKGELTNLSDHYGVKASIGLKPKGIKDQQGAKTSGNLFKNRAAEQMRWLKTVLLRSLEGLDPFYYESDKGVEERFCRSCRIQDVLSLLEHYLRAIDENLPITDLDDYEKFLRVRLDGYFSLF